MPTRCTHAFTERVISSRAKDKVCPAFLSRVTQGLLICFPLAVPTYPYQALSFQQPSSPSSALISSPPPAAQHWVNAARLPGCPAVHASDKASASSMSHTLIEGRCALFPFQKAGQEEVVIFN